jgi:hypothetical protein
MQLSDCGGINKWSIGEDGDAVGVYRILHEGGRRSRGSKDLHICASLHCFSSDQWPSYDENQIRAKRNSKELFSDHMEKKISAPMGNAITSEISIL